MNARHRTLWKVLAIVSGLFVALVLVGPSVLGWYLKPLAREKAVALLEERFDDVELEALDVTVLPSLSLVPRVSATGKGLSISLPGHRGAPPFITMEEFALELSPLGLIRHPVRVSSLRMEALTIQIPTGDKDTGDGDSEGGEDPPPAILVERLVADGAVLRILPEDPAKTPLEFVLHELEVASAGLGEPMRFDTVLQNPKPPGRIDAEGSFGPLDLSDPGASPVSGQYTFDHADLSVFGGIAGMLRSEGEFDGVLGRIEVSGFTETPDFQLTSAGHPVQLRTDFQAVVDGTSGDTFLVPIEATLQESSFHTEGGVSERPGSDGKTVCVNAEGTEDRIEDFLRLAMKLDEPVMTGKLRFKSLVMIPPGDVDMVEKLVLDGEFAIDQAQFPARDVQEKVDKLSDAGTGKSGEDDELAPLREERVFSDMRGTFELEGGVMTLSYLSFRVPGAAVTMRGTYRLVDETLDFQGELRLDAKLSETTSGIKSFLLKLIDPLFKKDDAGAVVPIEVTGSADDPRFGVSLTRVLTRDEVAPAPPATRADGWTKKIPSCVELLSLTPREAAAPKQSLTSRK